MIFKTSSGFDFLSHYCVKLFEAWAGILMTENKGKEEYYVWKCAANETHLMTPKCERFFKWYDPLFGHMVQRPNPARTRCNFNTFSCGVEEFLVICIANFIVKIRTVNTVRLELPNPICIFIQWAKRFSNLCLKSDLQSCFFCRFES